MKYLLVVLILISGLSASAKTEKSYYEAFYSDYLDHRAYDYPMRRKEALRKLPTFSYNDSEKVKQVIIERDLSYMSTTTSFQDLWKLRFKGKWEEKTLIAVANTARFYIDFCQRNINLSYGKDLGVINEILIQLKNTKGPQARIEHYKLVRSLLKIKQRSIALQMKKQIKIGVQMQTKVPTKDEKEIIEVFQKSVHQALKNTTDSTTQINAPN